MCDIDWAKAPEGATHYDPTDRCEDSQWMMKVSERAWCFYDGDDWESIDYSEVAHQLCEYIPRPTKQEWEGGLPPVGWEGEYTKPSGFVGRTCVWRWCVVVAHDLGGALIRTDKDKYHLLTVPEYEFRPLKSQQERQREDLALLCDMYIRGDEYGHNLADAILSRYNLEPKP